ncbi:MAG: 50S ribosomal protein L10e [Methanonatronarchaeales archaeon]|nr:50S ribosomal protein L10e [Methanonatronarchaeales archaeon]
MGEKLGKMFRSAKGQPYTRKRYIGGVPGTKIVSFEMGNREDKDSFPVEVTLRAEERCRITHNALESARVAANSFLMKGLKRLNYFFKLRVYPHDVLRENKMATGAGADRVQDGMRLAFGRPVGSAARVDVDQPLFSVRVRPENVDEAKRALKRASMKLPTPGRITVDTGAELVR